MLTPARELGGQRVLPAGEAYRREELTSTLVLVELDAVGEKRDGDVVQRRQCRKQVKALEDEADLTPVGGPITPREARDLVFAHRDCALVSRVHDSDEAQDLRLSRARRPHDREEFPGATAKLTPLSATTTLDSVA